MAAKVANIFEKRCYFPKEIALEMLKGCGLELFQAFREGLERFNKEIQQTMNQRERC